MAGPEILLQRGSRFLVWSPLVPLVQFDELLSKGDQNSIGPLSTTSPDSVSRCRELIAVVVSQIDGDPIVGDRLVDPALEITVAHFKKIIALQRAGRRNPMAHENAEDLTANVFVGRSVKHRSTIGFARHRSYGRTATVDKIAQPMGNLCPARSKRRRRKSTTER